MGRYTGFNILGTLTLPNKIGGVYLLTQKTPLMILIESECCGRFSINDRMELVFFNCYRNHSSLVLQNWDGAANVLHSR